MTFPSGIRALILLAACLWLAGCLPLPDNESEEKNPLIGDARAKKAAYNFQGAVDSLEKALEGNPRLALAHWELGLIFCQNVPDPAAAIYHFEKLLKLRPEWRQAETARQMINVCKIELAKNVPLGPQTPAIQQQMDRLTAKVHELVNEGNRLRTVNQSLQLQVQQLAVENTQLRERIQAYAAGLSNGVPPAATSGAPLTAAGSAPLTPPATPAPGPIRPTVEVARTNPGGSPLPAPIGATTAANPAPTTPAAASYRQHTIRSGETLTRIAQRYGVKLRSLILANPNLSPERLKVGQVIRIPES